VDLRVGLDNTNNYNIFKLQERKQFDLPTTRNYDPPNASPSATLNVLLGLQTCIDQVMHKQYKVCGSRRLQQ
jgi:hypothetical protein